MFQASQPRRGQRKAPARRQRPRAAGGGRAGRWGLLRRGSGLEPRAIRRGLPAAVRRASTGRAAGPLRGGAAGPRPAAAAPAGPSWRGGRARPFSGRWRGWCGPGSSGPRSGRSASRGWRCRCPSRRTAGRRASRRGEAWCGFARARGARSRDAPRPRPGRAESAARVRHQTNRRNKHHNCYIISVNIDLMW